jgi:hypothetical protein
MIARLHTRVMAQRPAAALLVVLALLLASTGCGSPAAAPVECPDEAYPAVELAVADEAGEPLYGVGLRYRVDGGEWLEWPENLGLATIIRGGPGRYQLELSRQGFATLQQTLEVPAEGEGACRPSAQTVSLQMIRTSCPEAPAGLTLTIDPPLAGLEATVRLPESGRQELLCQETAGAGCRQFSVTAAELGTYEIELDNLPGMGPMQVISDVVAYQTEAVALHLEHRGAQGTADVSGAETAKVSFSVIADEANCALADFRQMETALDQVWPGEDSVPPEKRPPLALSYAGSLTMTDLGVEACQAEPLLTALPFRAELPAGTDLAGVLVEVEYGEGWRTAACELRDDQYLCQVDVPNPLLDRPFAARIQAGGEEAYAMSLPFGGLCLIFQ